MEFKNYHKQSRVFLKIKATSITPFVNPQQFCIFIFTKRKFKTTFKFINLKAEHTILSLNAVLFPGLCSKIKNSAMQQFSSLKKNKNCEARQIVTQYIFMHDLIA